MRTRRFAIFALVILVAGGSVLAVPSSAASTSASVSVTPSSVEFGKPVQFRVSIYNTSSNQSMTVNLLFSIQDASGNVVTRKTDSRTMVSSLYYSDLMPLPSDAKEGYYTLRMDASTDDTTTTSTDIFQLKGWSVVDSFISITQVLIWVLFVGVLVFGNIYLVLKIRAFLKKQ